MTEFDAEFFLRRHAEDELQLEENRTAPARARTLAVLGLLPLERAQAVMDLYRRARVLRDEDGGFYGGDDDDDDPSLVHADIRVVPLDRALTAPFGSVRLRYVALGGGRIRAAAKITFSKNGHPHVARHHHGLTLDVTDDRGTTATLGFAGGGGNSTWRGHFSSEGQLSSRTQWLEILGERIELVASDHGATVTVHNVDGNRDPAVRAAGYLEHCLELERHDHWRFSPLPAVLDTVVASGSLAADSPAVIGTRAVQAALVTGHVADPQALPEQWRSVLVPPPRRRRAPKGDLMIGVATPVFDGVRVVVFVLSSRRSEFSVELEGSGAATDRFDSDEHDDQPMTFTATDDLGHHHLGHFEEWHSGGKSFGGTVEYHPPLDAAATRLDLAFNTPRSGAVVSVALRWGASS